MAYKDWLINHAKKHKKIVEKLLQQNYSKEQIIDYFDFENMKKLEVDFCPLYTKDKKCHEMESLNCYLCACPNFRYSDSGIQEVEEKVQYSFCSIESKDGRQGVYGKKIHQDCSGCQVPHHRSYVQKHFNLEWEEIMKDCEINR